MTFYGTDVGQHMTNGVVWDVVLCGVDILEPTFLRNVSPSFSGKKESAN
jgi:hypothetical protein